jgi:hypothetical protein
VVGVSVLAVLALVGIAVLANRAGDGDDRSADARATDDLAASGRDRPGSKVVDASATMPDAAPAPLTYHVVYEVTDGAGDQAVVNREEDWVRRPFDGRTELRRGTSPGGQLLQTSVYGLGRALVRNAGAAEPQLLEVPPGAPAADVRPDAVLGEALAAKVFVPRERRRILGVVCEVYRAPRPAVAGPLQPPEGAKDDDERSDLCIDHRGLLLEETTYRRTRLVHRKLAVALDVDVPLGDDRFPIEGTPLSLKDGGGSVRQLDPTSRPPGRDFYELPAAPEGFTFTGRYAVVPPQPDAFNDPTKSDLRIAAVADVYTRGADFLVIEQGGTLGGSPAFAADPTAAGVDLGALGRGEAILGLAGSQVRVLLQPAGYVRVIGTDDTSHLADIARQLRPQPPGELHFLDEG